MNRESSTKGWTGEMDLNDENKIVLLEFLTEAYNKLNEISKLLLITLVSTDRLGIHQGKIYRYFDDENRPIYKTAFDAGKQSLNISDSFIFS